MTDRVETRRRFLGGLAAMLAPLVLPPGSLHPDRHVKDLSPDERILAQKFRLARRQNLSSRPIGDVVSAVGTSFVGTPYVAHTLEAPGEEHLVVNLRGFDCVTFVETTLAIARCVRSDRDTLRAFEKELRLIRYRSGIIHGYASRLHYFRDWVEDNERKHLVRNISGDLGGVVGTKLINFMSTHVAAYPRLGDSREADSVRAAEVRLSSEAFTCVPKDRVAVAQEKLRSGDIIALATSMDGLDVSHTGIAVDSDGILRYLHAPLSGGSVKFSGGSLADYLRGRDAVTGIIVARPLEPA